MAVNCDLARLVKNVSRPRETREEVIAYYMARYPGQKTIKDKKKGESIRYEWKERLTDAIQTLRPESQRKNIARRFQARGGNETPWKGGRVSKAQQEEYKAIGARLPYIPPEEGVRITGTLCLRYADNECEDRYFDIQMTGEDFDFFLQSFELQSIVNVYMFCPADYGLGDDPREIPALWACECPGSGDCQWEDIKVTAIGEDELEDKEEPNKGYTSMSGGKPRGKATKKPRSPKNYARGPVLTPDEVSDLLQ